MYFGERDKGIIFLIDRKKNKNNLNLIKIKINIILILYSVYPIK